MARRFARSIGGCLLGVCCAAGAHAQTAKEKELEARIEALERLVRELKAEKAATAAPAQGKPPEAAAGAPAPIQERSITPNAVAGTRFSFSGFVKLDVLGSKYEDGEIADSTLGRDFYLPSSIPVGGEAESADLDMHVKQSRFIFGTDTELADKSTLSSRLEVDLYGSSLGDERATNTYGVQLRHAYVQYKQWLAGQTWSNFQDAGALPETTDFIGPTDGTIFVRQPQVRYTSGNWSFSLENPETTITPFGGGTRISSDDNNVPDLTAAYQLKFDNSYVRIAALGRQLKYETTGAGAIDDSAWGGALSIAGKIMFGPHDLRFMATAGDAIGRYVGVNFNNDVALSADGELETISGWAAFAAWRQMWSPAWRSTLMLSASKYDNDVDLTGTSASKSSLSWAVNTFYSPVPKLDVGLEFRHAERELESDAEGTMNRLHAAMKYSF